VQFAVAVDDVSGEIQVPPGVALGLCGIAAAGTTPLVIFGISWEEIPLAISQ
jgi:hypothetical protein